MAMGIEIVEQPIQIIMQSDFWQILIAISSFIIAGITALALWIQIHKQSKVSSANLILDLLKPWRTKSLQQLLSQISDPNITKYDENKLEKFLNQFEDIATFWKDKTLDGDHIKEFFGSNLKMIHDDEFIQKYIEKWAKKNQDYYFVNLRKLLDKVEKWKI